MAITVRPLRASDHLDAWLTEHWGADRIVVHGDTYTTDDLEGLVAERGGAIGGILTFAVAGDTLEIVTLDASRRREGIASILVDAVADIARERGLRRLLATVTNDSLASLGFFQSQGFVLRELRPGGALEEPPTTAPTAPADADYDLTMRDEIDLELVL